MRKFATAAFTVLAVLAATISPAAAAHGRGDLTVGLNGANEVNTAGDPNGSGKIYLSFFDAVDNPTVVFPNQHYICYELTFRNIDDPLMAHIHEVSGNADNPRKDVGGVVVDLFANTEMNGDETCVAVAEDVFDGILADPGEYYVNYHTAEHPSGAVRGQLHAFN